MRQKTFQDFGFVLKSTDYRGLSLNLLPCGACSPAVILCLNCVTWDADSFYCRLHIDSHNWELGTVALQRECPGHPPLPPPHRVDREDQALLLGRPGDVPGFTYLSQLRRKEKVSSITHRCVFHPS